MTKMVVNEKLEHVMKGLRACAAGGSCTGCPYMQDFDLKSNCLHDLMQDAKDAMETLLNMVSGYSGRLDDLRALINSLQQGEGERHAEK